MDCLKSFSIFIGYKLKKLLYTVGLLVFLDTVGFSVMQPILPTLFLDNSLGFLAHQSLHLQTFCLSLVVIAFQSAGLISNPIFGQLSDIAGRKKVLLIGSIGFMCSNLLIMIAIYFKLLWLFLCSEFLLGFFSGTYAAAGAILLEISKTEDDTVKNMRLITLMSVLGSILSPSFSILIPYKVTSLSLLLPSSLVLCLNLISFFSITIFLPKIIFLNNREIKPKTLNFINSFISAFKDTDSKRFFIGYLFFLLGLNICVQTFPMHLKIIYGANITQISYFFISGSLSYIIGLYVIHPLLSTIWNAKSIFIFAQLTTGIFIAIMGVAHHFENSINYIYILNAMVSLIFPCVPLYFMRMINKSSTNNKGVVMSGINQMSILSSMLATFFSCNYALLNDIEFILSTMFITIAVLILLKK